jgi:exodeoxyribonuclease V alpha subunit
VNTYAATFECLAAGYAPFLAAVRRDPSDRAGITAAFNGFRALCALRDGPRGVDGINAWAERHAREVLGSNAAPPGGHGRSPWYVGRPVIVLRNDAVLKLFNGDIGIALPDDHGELMVHFPAADGGLRAVAPVRLPEHRSAFALTVHKAQGSEFDAVLVVLPQRRSPVATRELLYTALTRAKQRVTLAGSAEVLGAAIGTPTQRHSGLLARLAEAARGQALQAA